MKNPTTLLSRTGCQRFYRLLQNTEIEFAEISSYGERCPNVVFFTTYWNAAFTHFNVNKLQDVRIY